MTLAHVDATLPTVTVSRRVLVVDDHRTFAELLAGALGAAGMTVVGVAHSAAHAVAMAQELQPEIVVMDIRMPQQDGLVATRRIREVAPDTVVAVVTAHRDPEWLVRAAQAGAAAFIPQGGAPPPQAGGLRPAPGGAKLRGAAPLARRP